MRSAYEQKENIRLRMMDLERKLAESEEERCKLEKTCDVLIRAFREQEKMQYKVLNKKYEKFLEDCLVRSRRNDLILRSLCRIEDRSRTLFAKTERLKLLKDRYISYLKLNEFKQDEVSHLWRDFPLKATDDVTTKAIRWKTFLASGHRTEEEFREARGRFFSRNEQYNPLTDDSMPEHFSVEQCVREKTNEVQGRQGQRHDAARTLDVNSHGPLKNATAAEIKYEEIAKEKNRTMRETTDSKSDNKIEEKYLRDISYPIEEGQAGQESIEKLRKAIEFPESKYCDPKCRVSPESEDIKPNELDLAIQSKSFSKLLKNNHGVITSANSPHKEHDPGNKNKTELENDQRPQERDIPSEISPNAEKTLPLGLDGIDYHNETYPESYYEQPVHHHNHTSIASDVILEEDETEQELDDEEKNFSSDGRINKPFLPHSSEGESHGMKTWEQARGLRTDVEQRTNCASNKESEPPNKGYLKSGDVDEVSENVKSQGSDSEKSSSEAKQSSAHSGKPKNSPSEKSEKSQTFGKSKLIHLLESDSESFQIEHGDGIPGNEDSDFDFSFSKN